MVTKITVELVDVNGSFKKLLTEAPKQARRFLSTAVFLGAGAVRQRMEAGAPLGPEGQGLTPFEHIKFDIEHRGKTNALMAQVGIFDNPDRAAVAMYNEYNPDRQPFMVPAAQGAAPTFLARCVEALAQVERALAQGY